MYFRHVTVLASPSAMVAIVPCLARQLGFCRVNARLSNPAAASSHDQLETKPPVEQRKREPGIEGVAGTVTHAASYDNRAMLPGALDAHQFERKSSGLAAWTPRQLDQPTHHYRHLKVRPERVDQERTVAARSQAPSQAVAGADCTEGSPKVYARVGTGLQHHPNCRRGWKYRRCCPVCNSCIERANVCKPGVEPGSMAGPALGPVPLYVLKKEPGVAGA